MRFSEVYSSRGFCPWRIMNINCLRRVLIRSSSSSPTPSPLTSPPQSGVFSKKSKKSRRRYAWSVKLRKRRESRSFSLKTCALRMPKRCLRLFTISSFSSLLHGGSGVPGISVLSVLPINPTCPDISLVVGGLKWLNSPDFRKTVCRAFLSLISSSAVISGNL